MGCGWYRTAYYPPEALIDRRSVDDLADELVARDRPTGWGRAGVRPGIIGEIGTDKPWVSPAEERVHRAAARAARRTGLAITTHAVLSDVGLAQLRIFEEEGADPGRVVIGHADSYPILDHYLAIIERGASVEFDFLGMSFRPLERHGEGRIVELLCELLARGHADRILLSQDVCHDSQLKRYGGNGYTYLAETFLPRLRAAGVSDAEIETMTVREPAAAPDDRVEQDAAMEPPPRLRCVRDADRLMLRRPRRRTSAFERGLDAQRDIARQRDADRAAVPGRFGGCHEVLADDARHHAAHRQRARHDPPAGVELVEGDLGRDVEAVRRRPGAAEGARQRHREAGGVRGRDQLLRARLAVGRLGPGGPGDGQAR